MISPVELRRILGEWRLRMQRVKEILQPPTWNEQEWRQFSQALALMVRDHGRSWIIEPNVYWDLRWHLQDGAELICQIEHVPGERTSLVVAQNGGFAAEVGSYTWLWAEFNMEGNFSRDPYWVEGTWKEALTALLLPLDRQASYLLAGRAETPAALLLQEGARPNDQNHLALLPGLTESSQEDTSREQAAASPAESPRETASSPSTENGAASKTAEPEKPVDTVAVGPETPQVESAPEKTPAVDAPESFTIRWGTVYRLKWKDVDDLAYALLEKFPRQDPTVLTLAELREMVLGLDNFSDEPTNSNQKVLEAIQMSWYEEVG
jgi:FeS assembly protein IscX